MSCLLTKSRNLACNEFIGGLKSVFFINYGEVDPVIDIGGVITDLNSGLTVYKYDLKGTSSLTETLTTDYKNGITMVDQQLILDLQGGDYETSNELKLLGYGRPHVIVLDNYGAAKLVGRVNGTNVQTSVHQTGSDYKEKYGYTVTMLAEERSYANYLSGSTVEDAFAGMTNVPDIATAIAT